MNNNGAFHFSTASNLLNGKYEGSFTINELQKNGSIGIGTINRLDGELIVIDGKSYSIKSDGKAYLLNGDEKIPFAVVCDFQPSINLNLQNIDFNFEKLEEYLNKRFSNSDRFYAFRINGEFPKIVTRSGPKVNPPFPPFKEVIKHTVSFKYQNVKGWLIGFKSPEISKGINIPGYHFHFIDDSYSFGGHVDEFQLNKANIEVQELSEFHIKFD